MTHRFCMFVILVLATKGYAQISGTVQDEHQVPIPYATILEKGTNNYTTSNEDGSFNISPEKVLPIILEIRAVGSEPKSIEIYSSTLFPLNIKLNSENLLQSITVTARRRMETAQEVPIPITVLSGPIVDDAGAFNVNRIKEMVPSVQLYSSNPRNTTLNIRGMGSTFGLTNDGIDPGVGFYVDGVYYARPAATSLDFIDIERIEVLRGPQGTLFGKNTTAGAFNITTKSPSFNTGAGFELSYGNYGFIQAKTSITGSLVKDKLATRISFSGTQRDGTIYNIAKDEYVNDLNNIGGRAQLLFTPNKKLKFNLSGDVNSQQPNGYAQVFAGVVKTQRPDFRQFENIIASLDYNLPSRNPFDRIIDHDTPWRSLNQLGGIALNMETKMGFGSLTSTTAWRYWNWGPSNDRDFTGLPVLSLSQAPSRHDQWTQEIRYAGSISEKISGVIGAFFMHQDLRSNPYHTEESGAAQWRFSENNQDSLWHTPGLLDGYGIKTTNRLESIGAAVFTNVDWAITQKLHLMPGVRFNYDKKEADYKRKTYGGLQTNDPALLALKERIYSNQEFNTTVNNNNLSGQLTLRYQAHKQINTFATLSTSYKPVGVNLGGLPTSNGSPMLELAEVKPEYVTHTEVGIKTNPNRRSTLNIVFHNTQIKDYQTLVQTPELGVNRGYLANAEKVQVRGIEIDGNLQLDQRFYMYASVAYTDGRYISFKNAPVPLEEVGGEQAFKDVSGSGLPGISNWAGSAGLELTSNETHFLDQNGRFFIATDVSLRSSYSSSPSQSKYLNINGYALLNARIGFRATEGVSLFIWGRNILDTNYFEQLLAASGSAGHYAAVLGDPRTYGITLKYTLL